MDYDRVIIELLNRIGILEEKVAVLESNRSSPTTVPESETQNSSKKYRYLTDYLFNSNSDNIKLSFAEIEEILGFGLPNSATLHRAFWANTDTHSIAISWMSVGYETVEVNLNERYVVFEKKRKYESMTITEQMRTIVNEIVSEYGAHYKISLKEFYELLGARFNTNQSSIIPSDYCYDRVNKGIKFTKNTRLLLFLGDGMYECLGENHPYTGMVYTREKGSVEDIAVGEWRNGELTKFDNWKSFHLR